MAALDGSMRTCIIRAQLVPLDKVAADELETCTETGAVAYKFEKSVLLLDVDLPTL
jgi:hypothetical protein